jgi:hypothetical protein
VWGILPPISAYSFRHLHFPKLQHPSQDTFTAVGTLSYHTRQSLISVASVTGLVPTIFGANPLDW